MRLISRPAPACAALALAALFHLAAVAAYAGPGDPSDVCRSVFEGNKKAAESADAAAPHHMVLFGDSIMWGQGLRERDKFWCRVKQWVEQKTERNVWVWPYAHAGAVIEQPELAAGKVDERVLESRDQKLRPGGEVNVSFPTINDQVTRAVEQMKSGTRGVSLVLVDGCINDVNFRTFLSVKETEESIREATERKCGPPMRRLLKRITTEFPNAYVVVTGYFPIIYKGVKDEQNGREVVKGTTDNPLTRLAFKVLGGGQEQCAPREGETEPRPARDCLDALSRVWYETSNGALASAVEGINREVAEAGRDPQLPARVYFAELNFPPDYGFSTKQTMLWNIRFNSTGVGGLRKVIAVTLDFVRAIDTNDDRWDERGDQCKRSLRAFKQRLKELREGDELNAEQKQDLNNLEADLKYFEAVCRRGSLGHPNRFGALLYAQAITSQLQTILPRTGWKKTGGAAVGGGGGGPDNR